MISSVLAFLAGFIVGAIWVAVVILAAGGGQRRY